MVLPDTSVWIDHLRQGRSAMTSLLSNGLILVHPFVTGELACGTVKDRKVFFEEVSLLAPAIVASNEEVLKLIEKRKLWGRGLGWTDAHLLASALLSRARLWTLDKRLARAASDLGIS